MNLSRKRIGIWGYGVVGRSTLRYLTSRNVQISVYDQKELSLEQQQEIAAAKAKLYLPNELEQFLAENDYLIPSGGIDLRKHEAIRPKLLAEFDLFCDSWRRCAKPVPIIGITGTVGKTSVTHLLSEILKAHGYRVATGGNIGVGLFDLLKEKKDVDYAVLELSSYQLELCRKHAPDLAIITNIHPNHLDRHGSAQAYQDAKSKILTLQTPQQKAIVPFKLREWLRKLTPQKTYTWFVEHSLFEENYFSLRPGETFYSLEENAIWVKQCEAVRHFSNSCRLSPIPKLSFPGNWVIILAALSELGIRLYKETITNLTLPDHRFSCIATHNNISFYNDSKSTVLEATLAAVQQLHSKPIILFLGGLSKGVDRASALAQFKRYSIKHIVCFGKEADELAQACTKYSIAASSYPTLEAAFTACNKTIAESGDQVLFSPAGASFDLFPNYKARGERFKELVADACKP